MDNEFFDILKDLDISFYNSDNQIIPKVKVELDFGELFEIEYHLIPTESEDIEDEEEDENGAWY